MADIRINALATTAASTASDDFVAVDGSANGTRKLNAYSPTFGGNLTVSGTATFNGSSVAFANSAAPAGPNIKFENVGGSTQLSETASSSFYYKAYSHNFLSLAGTSLMALSNAGNLTVSGTGNSSVAGNLGIGETSPAVPLHVKTTGTGTGDFDNAIATFRSTASGRTITLQFSDTANQAYISSKSGALLFGTGGATTRATLDTAGNLGLGVTPSSWGSGWAVLQPKGGSIGSNGAGSFYIQNNAYYDGSDWRYVASSDATRYAMLNSEHYWYNANSGTAGNVITFTEQMRLFATGNLFIGASPVDGGQKLQVSGTANFSSGSSANTLSLISTDSTAYSATGYNSAYRVWLYGNGATSAYNFIRFSGGGSNEAAFGTVQNASGRAEFVWQTYDGSAYGERLRIASGGDATFAGTVTLPNNKAIYFKEVGGTAQRFALNSGDVIYIEPDQLHKISIGGAGVTNVGAGGIGVAGNSVFNGSIAIGNTVQTAASVASTHKVTISIGGTTYYLLATNV